MSDVSKEEYLKQLRKELHKPVKKSFVRRRVYVSEKDHTWAMDLVDMSNLSRQNKGFNWMLTIMDLWTRYAWSVPLKTKKAVEVLQAFKRVITESNRQPRRIWVDQGREFYNAEMTHYLDEHGINRYSTFGEGKSVMIERFNRTLRAQMWRIFTEFQTHNWIDRLDELMEWYNFRPHHGIDNRSPYSLSRWSDTVLDRQFCLEPKPDSFLKAKLAIGDFVRISKTKGLFEKGYTANWSQEQFEIIGIRESLCDDPPVYFLMDWFHRPIKGGFYEEEVQRVKYPNTYLIEKVLKTDKKGKRMQVRWLGLGIEHDSWIPLDNEIGRKK